MTERPQGDFGRRLREARERRGVSLRQISNATKIGMSALEALERNDISRLPGGIFSRGIVRSYAVEVGLDAEATIQDFIAQFPQDSVTAGHPTSTHAEDHEAIESDRRTATTFVRLIALSIPVAVALLYFGTAGRRESAPDLAPEARPVAAGPPPVDAPPAPAPEPAPEPVLAPATVASPVRIADAGEASGRLTVSLSAARECWVSATIDGERTFQRLLQPGEEQTLEVRREIVLTVGDASAIALTLNGAPARPLGRDGEVVTTRLSRANFKEYIATP